MENGVHGTVMNNNDDYYDYQVASVYCTYLAGILRSSQLLLQNLAQIRNCCTKKREI